MAMSDWINDVDLEAEVAKLRRDNLRLRSVLLAIEHEIKNTISLIDQPPKEGSTK